MVADVVWDIFIENMVKIKRTLAEKKFSVRVLFLSRKDSSIWYDCRKNKIEKRIIESE